MTASRRIAPKMALVLLVLLVGMSIPAWAANIRFIVFSSSLNAGDLAMRNLMQSLGHTVTVKSAPSSSASDTTGQDLVVISSSVGPGEVNTKFRAVTKPVITLKYALYDEMGMVSTAAEQAGGFAGGQTVILAPGHDLAAGLTGTVQAFSPDDNFNWGLPAASALRIASLPGNAGRATIFAYETGAEMVGMNAPARRLAFFYRDNGATRTTAQGQALFNAALNWSLGAGGPPPVSPSFSFHPASASVVAPQVGTFSVSVSGTPAPTLQWYRNGAVIPDATAATYTTPATVPGDNGASFHVVATNSAGAATSNPAVLEVGYAPVFTGLPDAITLVSGQEGVFTAAAHANPPITSWEWRFNGGEIPDSDPDPAVLRTPPLPVELDGGVITVVVTNAHGSATSPGAVVTIHSVPVIEDGPNPVTVNAGQPAGFDVVATGNPTPTYQWKKNGVVIVGATAASLLTEPATLADEGAVYSVVVSNVAGSVEASAILTVRRAPVITAHPQPLTVAHNSSPAFSVTADGTAPLAYRWQRNGVDIAGATSSTYTLPVVTGADDSSFYRVLVSNAVGADTSDPALLRVQYPAFFLSPSPLLLVGGVGNLFVIEVQAAGNPAPTYQWTSTNPAFTGPDSSGRRIRVMVPSGPPMSTHSYIVDAANSLGAASKSISVASNGPSAFRVTPENTGAAAGQSLTLTAVNPPPVGSLQWERNGQPIPGATSSTLTLASMSTAQVGTYRLGSTQVGQSYTLLSDSAVVSLYVPPTLGHFPDSVYSYTGEPVTFTAIVSGSPAPTYQWRKNGFDILGATGATYTTGPLGQPEDGSRYSLRVSNAAGTVTGPEMILSVRYAPIITSHPSSIEMPAGETYTFTVAALANPPPGPSDYIWRRNGTAIPGATGPSYTIASAQLSDNGAAYSVIVRNFLGADTSENAILTVFPPMSPPAIVSQPQDLFLYPGDNAVFRIGVSGYPVPTISWTILGNTDFPPGPYPGDSLWLGPVELSDDGTRVEVRVQSPLGLVVSRQAWLHVSPRPTRHLVSLTGELFASDNLSPIGYDHPASSDIIVKLFTAREGGTAVYEEQFLRNEGKGVGVNRGLFTVRLGEGRSSQVLPDVVAAHADLFAEITVEVEGLPRETLSPRTPVTSPFRAGVPRIVQGTVDPTSTEPVGTYYENTVAGSTWLRMPSTWIRIAP